MKVETFKELLVEMEETSIENAFLVFKKTQDGFFFYRDETGEIQEEVIDLTGLSTEELVEFIFDNYACKQVICNFDEWTMFASSLDMVVIVEKRIKESILRMQSREFFKRPQ